MALHIFNEYDPRAVAPDASYPYGSFLNAQPGGTPLDYKFMNDIYGMLQKFLTVASIVPNGSPDTVNASQYYDAMAQVFGLAGGVSQVITLNLGAWDMDATSVINIAHGVLDITKIRQVQILILRDDGVYIRDLTTVAGSVAGSWAIDTVNFQVARTLGGLFDQLAYNDAIMNRGWITFGVAP